MLWRYKTESLANLGRKEEAFEACHKSLELNKIDPKTHWLEAMIELDCGNTVASEKALKQALFLDPNFVEAQYWLALSLFHRNEHEKGLKNIQVALDKVEKVKFL